MARVKCNTCGAEYRTIQRDGTTYFHVCAPVTMVKARRENGSEIEQPLDQYAGLTIVESTAQRDELVNGGADPTKIVVERQRRSVRRADFRDENTRRRAGDRGEQRILRAEGKGITVLKSDADVAAEDADAV